MANRLGSKTTLFSKGDQDGSGPIGQWLSEWLLPAVWFVLAIVLLGRAVWF
jgi:hypothetical protein